MNRRQQQRQQESPQQVVATPPRSFLPLFLCCPLLRCKGRVSDVAASHGAYDELELQLAAAELPLTAQYKHGTKLISFCLGSLPLAFPLALALAPSPVAGAHLVAN